MIRTNLLAYKPAEIINAGKHINSVLTMILVIQLVLLGIRLQDAARRRENFDAAVTRLDVLKAEKENLQTNADLKQLAGKVAARNNWFADRRNSPLNRLAKLQKDCPNNHRFLSYNADLTGGRILLTAPDLNAVSAWLNGHFNQRGNLSVTGREENLLQIQFVWSD
jgi:hypothetical protein